MEILQYRDINEVKRYSGTTMLKSGLSRSKRDSWNLWIQSRKRVYGSILGETSTCKELDNNNFCNKKPKIGQVKDIRTYFTKKLKERVPPIAPEVIE